MNLRREFLSLVADYKQKMGVLNDIEKYVVIYERNRQQYPQRSMSTAHYRRWELTLHIMQMIMHMYKNLNLYTISLAVIISDVF
jgi:hypothetical protein